jgi:hypothetical protein
MLPPMARWEVLLILNLMLHDILLRDVKEFPQPLDKLNKLGQYGYGWCHAK